MPDIYCPLDGVSMSHVFIVQVVPTFTTTDLKKPIKIQLFQGR